MQHGSAFVEIQNRVGLRVSVQIRQCSNAQWRQVLNRLKQFNRRASTN